MLPIKDYPGPRRRMPWMTWAIILLNIAIFLYQVSLGPDASAFMFAYSVVPFALTHVLLARTRRSDVVRHHFARQLVTVVHRLSAH